MSNEEQREYEKFCAEFIDKVRDINDDFYKMSDKNKSRFKSEVKNMLAARGMVELLKFLN